MKNAQKIVLNYLIELADATGLFTCNEFLTSGEVHLISEKFCESHLHKGEREEFEIGFNDDGTLFGMMVNNGYYREFDNLEDLIQWVGINEIINGVPEVIFFKQSKN